MNAETLVKHQLEIIVILEGWTASSLLTRLVINYNIVDYNELHCVLEFRLVTCSFITNKAMNFVILEAVGNYRIYI